MIRQGAPTRGRRPPTEWELRLEAEARERARNLAELMAELKEARETGAEWYVWVASGRPLLTEAEYARVGRYSSPRNRRARSTRESSELETAADDQSRQGVLM